MSIKRAKIHCLGRKLEIEYTWVGTKNREAPVVVFLHEGLGSVAMWGDFPQCFCERLGTRGLVYSRFGYGHSTPRPNLKRFPVHFMHREATEVLPELLDALGVTNAWLLGHSDGASIALLAAAHLPQRIQGVVVMAPHIFVEDITLERIRSARIDYQKHGLRERLARYHGDVDSAFYGWNDVWLDPSFREWTIEAELEKIACPVLAIQGEKDEYGTLDQIYGIQRRVPQTRLLVLPACRHSPYKDQPETVITEAAAFIKNQQSA